MERFIMTEEQIVQVAEESAAIEVEVELLERTHKVKKILKWTAIGVVAGAAVIYAGKVLKDNKIIEVVEEVIEEVGE